MTDTKALLELAQPGHWGTEGGYLMAMRYLSKDRSDLAMGAISDFQLANEQYLVGRYDLALVHYQTAAKERIRWLSAKLAATEAALRVIAQEQSK